MDDQSSCEKHFDSHRRVLVWHAAANVESKGGFEERCESVLEEPELLDANRFRRPTTRNQHVIGRAMAKTLLARIGDSKDAAADRRSQARGIAFDRGQFGKPRVVTPPALSSTAFNIAHTDGLVLCGVAAPEVELLGVDVESLGRRTSTELAERYFSKPEVDYLRSLPKASQKACFLRIWTLKEAYIKAIGTGLHTPLSDFAFSEIDSPRPRIEFLQPGLEDGREWRFECCQPRPGFIASVAYAGAGNDAANSKAFVSEAEPVHWSDFESLFEGGR